MFLDGRTEIADEHRSGRPSVINEEMVNTVLFLIQQDRRITVAEIERYSREEASDPLLHGTVVNIIHEHLGMHKVCAHWVPKLLTDDHNEPYGRWIGLPVSVPQ